MHLELAGRVRLLIFLGCFVVFFASPVTALSDSKFALLTAESLLKNHTPSLRGFEIPGLDRLALPARRSLPRPEMFYQLVRVRGQVLYAYPHGGSFLSLPFVATFDVFGVSPV